MTTMLSQVNGQPVVPPVAAGDLVANLQEHAHHARGAYSENTERALRSDTAVFATWCTGRGLTALPAVPGPVAAFVDAMAWRRAPATIRRYVSSIASLHRAAGLESPVEAESVKLALRRMHREKGRRQKQAQGITLELRNRMLDATHYRNSSDSPQWPDAPLLSPQIEQSFIPTPATTLLP